MMTESTSLLLDALVRSTVLLLAGLAATVVLRRRSAALRHWVLAATIAAAALGTPLAWALPDWPVAAVPTPAVFRFEPAAPMAVVETAPAAALAPTPDRAVAPIAPSPLPSFGVIWMLGFAAGLVSLVAQIVRLARISARATLVTDERWTRIVADMAARYGLRRTVPILQTESSDLLATWGLFRPRILVPAGAARWTDERIRVVVCHELAHVQRRDWAVQIAADVVRRAYWFQPLMWLAGREMRRESEHACDDVVLAAGVEAQAYAGHLLQLAGAGRTDYKWASAVPMARRSTLERRIVAMLNSARNRRALSQRSLVVTTILLAAVTLTSAALHSEQPRAGQLVGTIYDGSGGVLPGVEVTLAGADGAKATATTDAAGKFQFPATAGGKYVLAASLPGFNAFRDEFEMKAAADWDRAITLQVGKLQETVTVTASRQLATQQTPGIPAPKPIRVGGNIKAPMKLVNVNPTYPDSMRVAGRGGLVPLDAVISTDGSVVFARVLSANVHPDFAAAALDAVRQWKFSPTLLNGKPVEVVMSVTVNFSLE